AASTGRVIDVETRRPVADASVRAVEMEVETTDEDGGYYQTRRAVPEHVVAEARSDAEGRFLLASDEPLVAVEAMAPGGRHGTADRNQMGGEILVEIWPPETIVVKGQVVDDRDQPVPGATLSIAGD